MKFSNIFRSNKDTRIRATWRLVITYGVALSSFLLLLVIGQILAERLVPVLQESAFLLPAILAFGVTAISALYASVRLDQRSLQGYGLDFNRVWWRDFGGGALIAVLLIILGSLISLGMGWASVTEILSQGDGAFVLSFVFFFGLIVVQGVFLEVVFRAITIPNIANGLTARSLSSSTALLSAVFVAAILFTLFQVMFAQTPGDLHITVLVVSWLLLGGLLGVSFILTGNLALSLGVLIGYTTTTQIGIAETGAQLAVEPPALVRLNMDLPSSLAAIDGLTIPLFVLGYACILGWVRWTQGHITVDQTLSDW